MPGLWQPVMAELRRIQVEEMMPHHGVTSGQFRRIGFLALGLGRPRSKPKTLMATGRGCFAKPSIGLFCPPEIRIPSPAFSVITEKVKHCWNCRKAFFQDGGGRFNYCSDACVSAASARAKAASEKARSVRRKEWRAQIRGRELCEWCNEFFTPKRSTAKFCSASCRSKAHYRMTKAGG